MIRAMALVSVLALLSAMPAGAVSKKPRKPVRAAPRVPFPAPPAPPLYYPPVVMPPAPPAPPAPPLPPPDNPPGVAPKPLTNPTTWVTDDDYPLDAKRAGLQGRVTARMAIDRKGMPYRCWVVRGSGSNSLDATTCYILQSKARFAPALDPAGKPIEWTWQVSMRWLLADEDIPAVAPAPPLAKAQVRRTGSSGRKGTIRRKTRR